MAMNDRFAQGADLGGFQDLPEDRYDNYRARYNQRKNRLLLSFFNELHEASDFRC